MTESSEFLYPTLEAVYEAYADAEADVKADYDEGTWESGGCYEIVQALSRDCPEDVGREFCRIEGVTFPADLELDDEEEFEFFEPTPPPARAKLGREAQARLDERMELRRERIQYELKLGKRT